MKDYLIFCPILYLFIFPFIHPSIYVSIYLSIYLCNYLSIYACLWWAVVIYLSLSTQRNLLSNMAGYLLPSAALNSSTKHTAWLHISPHTHPPPTYNTDITYRYTPLYQKHWLSKRWSVINERKTAKLFFLQRSGVLCLLCENTKRVFYMILAGTQYKWKKKCYWKWIF